MTKKRKPTLPVEPLRDLLAWWKKCGIQGMIIGGLAVALRARPRVTRDVDAVVFVPDASWTDMLAKAKSFHLTPRDPDPLWLARESRMLLLSHQPSAINIDISLGSLSFEREAIARATVMKIGRVRVPVATVEDLLVLKAIAHRDIDLIDIANLLDVNPEVDGKEVLRQADEFAQAMEMPEIYLVLDTLLAKHRKKKPRK